MIIKELKKIVFSKIIIALLISLCIVNVLYETRTQIETKEQIAADGLSAMETWMREIGLVMNIRELGVTEDMLDGIADGTFIMKGGYKVLSKAEVIDILKQSM